MTDLDPTTLMELTTNLIVAYVEKNAVPRAELPGLIASLHGVLSGLGHEPAAPVVENRTPAVPIKKSVTDEFIISLEDGRKLKSMKRYLAKRGMTPEDYRAKWSLPGDYPMVAPAYAKARSEMAHRIGLGTKRQKG